jgi:hypothetical protein
VAFKFEKAGCVVVGTFNMYILHPQWLERHKIVEPDVAVQIETNMTQPGFRFRFPKDKAIWSVAPNRLAIESQDPRNDCGQTVAKILRALPETPLFAMGNNVHYRAELSERETLSPSIRDFPEPGPLSGGQSVLRRAFHTTVKCSDRMTVNLQMSLEEDSIELACNVHDELGNSENANEVAVTAAERFFDNRAEIEALAQHFFGASIDHDPHNS